MTDFLGTYLEPVSYFLYVVLLGFQYRQKKGRAVLVLLLFYALAILLTLYANYLLTAYPKNDPRTYNEWVYNLVFFLTCPFLAYFFIDRLVDQSKRNLVRALVLCVSVFFSVYFLRDLFRARPAAFYSYPIASSYLAVVVFCFLYFNQVVGLMREKSIFSDKDFWLVCGYFVNYFGNFFVVLTYRYFSALAGENPAKSQSDLLTVLWSAHNVLLFFSAVITLIFSLWIIYRKESPSPSLPRSSF